MLSITPENIAYVVGAAGAIAAAWERWQSSRKQTRTDNDQDLINDAKLHQERANTFSELYAKEASEHQRTRDFWHGEANKWNVANLEYQAKIADYQGRPDFGEIIKVLQEQSKATQELSATLRSQSETLSGILRQQSKMMLALEKSLEHK